MSKQKTLPAEDVIAYRPELARELGSVAAAILYQQLYYWSDKGARSDGFIYKSRRELEEETALTSKQQRTALAILSKKGWLQTVKRRAEGSNTIHYKCLQSVKTVVAERATPLADTAKGGAKRAKRFAPGGKLITETTTETTHLVPNGTKGTPSQDVTELISHFEETFGFPLTGRVRQRRAAQTILVRCKSLAVAKRSIDAAFKASQDRYSGVRPSELAWLQNTRNWNKLVAYAKKPSRGIVKV